MNWQRKAGIQRLLSALPAGEQINYALQKYITHNLPVSDETMREKIAIAAHRIKLFLEFRPLPLSEATLLEFGAGWDMIGPLTMHALGVDRQLLLDITPHLRFELINDALKRLPRQLSDTLYGTQFIAREFSADPIRSQHELQDRFGITYKAPSDAANSTLDTGSIDLISTNSTLEHIPPLIIEAILRESYRILRNDGLIIHFIDMKDHYSYFDPSISVYNFLQYSAGTWDRFNSSLHYQNRLRLPEYRTMIEDAGFEIVFEEIEPANQTELAMLQKMEIDPMFSRFEESDLSAQIYRVVARKARSF